VQTQFGWHLIEVTDRKEQPESSVAASIRQAILAPHQDEFLTLIDKNLGTSKVIVSPRYGTFRKGDPAKGESPGVVPPNAPASVTTTSTTLPEGAVTIPPSNQGQP
jgi:hypothetical protein